MSKSNQQRLAADIPPTSPGRGRAVSTGQASAFRRKDRGAYRGCPQQGGRGKHP
jgi:hypothetical protein